ncbi:MAG: hypothetical protein K2J51_07640 [Alistipes sp.]|nr:hypothetical protein [Alistipes sp.]MDE6779320.1 hypothetical protein [Alistipes sp.]
MTTVVLIPTEQEAAPLRRLAPHAPIRICGVGPAAAAAATAAIIRDERPDRILLAGIAGAYGDAAEVGEVYAVAEEREPEIPARFAAVRRAGFMPEGLHAVVANTSTRTEAPAAGAQLENMEGAAVYAVCTALGVPCCEVRAVSNRVGEPFAVWRTHEAAERLAQAVARILDAGK